MVDILNKRRLLMLKAIVIIAIIGTVSKFFITLSPVTWFDEQIHWYIAYGMVAYKLIELRILYWLFIERALMHLNNSNTTQEHALKSMKRFFNLTPHGSTIFGLVTYKLTGVFTFFIVFMIIATITLYLASPSKFSKDLKVV